MDETADGKRKTPFDNGRFKAINLSQDDHERVVEELREIFPHLEDDDHAVMLSQFSPSWVEIVASCPTWKAVFAASAGYLLACYGKKLAEMAAEETPNTVRSLVATLRNLAERRGHRAEAVLKIPGPGRRFTKLIVFGDQPEETERDICYFIQHLDGIRVAIDRLSAQRPAGEVLVHVRPDSFSLEWLNRADCQVYVQPFDEEGGPIADAERKRRV